MSDRSYIVENDHERRRLEALVSKLDDAALSRSMPGGWTVAAVLAHLAFWDARVVVLCERLARGLPVRAVDSAHVDWINDAAKPAQLALSPRRAATLSVESAHAADQAVAALSDESLGKNKAAESPINVLRAEHRREHIDEIERALTR